MSNMNSARIACRMFASSPDINIDSTKSSTACIGKTTSNLLYARSYNDQMRHFKTEIDIENARYGNLKKKIFTTGSRIINENAFRYFSLKFVFRRIINAFSFTNLFTAIKNRRLFLIWLVFYCVVWSVSIKSCTFCLPPFPDGGLWL